MSTLQTFRRFEDWPIWAEGRRLVRLIYPICKQGLLADDEVLSRRLRESAVALSTHLAECADHAGSAEFLAGLGEARRAVDGLRSQLYLAHDLGLLEDSEADDLLHAAEDLAAMISTARRDARRGAEPQPWELPLRVVI